MGHDRKIVGLPFEAKFTVCVDRIPLAYVRESKFRAPEIRWLSKLALFYFDIKYRTDKSNKTADTLSCHPFVQEEMDSASDSEEYETILYTILYEELEDNINGEILPIECKVAIQEKHHEPAKQDLGLHYSVAKILGKVSPSEMKDVQQDDPTIGQVV